MRIKLENCLIIILADAIILIMLALIVRPHYYSESQLIFNLQALVCTLMTVEVSLETSL